MWFKFTLTAGARQEIWRRTDNVRCRITVSLTGRGPMTAALRGY